MKKPREQEIIKKQLQQAEYIGEDGGMVVDARFTIKGAYRKMIARLREDCGEAEVTDFKEACKPEELGIAFLHLITDKNKDEFDTDSEWYVSIKQESPYKVWCYWGN